MMEKLMLDLDGIKLEFGIEGYHQSTRENWDDEWCMVTANTNGRFINYVGHSCCMLCCEVEWLYEKLMEIEHGILTENIEIPMIEPDFEFKMYPNVGRHPYTEWKFNLWDDKGAMSLNSFTLTLDDEDMKTFRLYLEKVIHGEV